MVKKTPIVHFTLYTLHYGDSLNSLVDLIILVNKSNSN